MTTGMDLWDGQVWSFVLTLALLLAAMLLANTLRNSFGFIRRMIVRSSVLGGFMLLALNAVCTHAFHTPLYSTGTLETLTYHGLGLGFAALALRKAGKRQDREGRRDALNAGITVVNGYLLQAVMGLVVTIALYYAIGSFFASGVLLPMGYGQGPGQAYNWGHTYELRYGFENGTSFGLAVAAMGFVSASVGGVIHLNLLRRRGLFHGELGRDAREELSLDTFTGENEIPLTESMDKFTVQVGLAFGAYALAYLFMKGLNSLLDPAGTGAQGIAGTLQGMIWGFQFLFSTVFALAIRAVMGALRRRGVIRREYANDFLQNRIAGFMFDLMVVASIAAIDLRAFLRVEFILPLGIICLLGAVGTYFYLRFVCRRVFPDYEQAAFLSLYGMQTGTASTGTILLREIDPLFETRAADNIVYHMPWAILFGAPMFLLVGVAPQSVQKSWMTLGVCAGLFLVFNILLLRRSLFGKKKAAPGKDSA